MGCGESASEKLWARVNKTDGCWLWTGPVNPKGYGYVPLRRTVLAHRLSYQLAYGDVPKGTFICHRCDTPACVRPSHLYAGDVRTNAADAKARGRLATGKRNGRHTKPECTARGTDRRTAKLTWDDVAWIRSLRGQATQKVMAESFGVSGSVICNILNNKAWHEEYAP
jgi:hypothetical protein